MSNIQRAIQKYEEIYRLLSADRFTISDYKEISYGLQFTVRQSNWSGLIRIYQNKKDVVRVDLSQLDRSDSAGVVRKLIGEERGVLSQDVLLNEKQNRGCEEAFTLAEIQLPLFGSDESGKGDYFGSLVVACVYTDEKISKRLVEAGAKDSKSLSDAQIGQIAKKIKGICADKFAVIEIPPEKYNQMYADFKSENKTLNDILAWAHAKSIETLLDRVDCQTAVIDKFCDDALLTSKLQEKGQQLKIVQIYRAESSCIAVAAASILARDRFVNGLNQLGKEHGVQLPKGASDKVVSVARQLVEKNGESIIKEVAKMHFKTTQAVSS